MGENAIGSIIDKPMGKTLDNTWNLPCQAKIIVTTFVHFRIIQSLRVRRFDFKKIRKEIEEKKKLKKEKAEAEKKKKAELREKDQL